MFTNLIKSLSKSNVQNAVDESSDNFLADQHAKASKPKKLEPLPVANPKPLREIETNVSEGEE